MKYLIVEDEYHAAKRLKSLIQKHFEKAICVDIIDSVQDSVAWLESRPHPDVAFFDIQLADGLSFSIFQKTEVEIPVIFTTAFDEYALKAFKANSVDYLLKPVDEDELIGAINKYQKLFGTRSEPIHEDVIDRLMRRLVNPEHVKRFLIKSGTALKYVPVEQITLFYSENGLTYLQTREDRKHHIDYTLEQVEDLVDPDTYFRVNRSLVVHIDAIQKISSYFNSRLKLTLTPKYAQDAIVSRDKVKKFKQWVTGGKVA